MSENAELWSWNDEKSQRTTLINWLKNHNVSYDNNMTLEELRQLYIRKETGKI